MKRPRPSFGQHGGEQQAQLPPPAFASILELARQRLDERRWRQRWACRPLSAGKT